jgi:hypothetical protein
MITTGEGHIIESYLVTFIEIKESIFIGISLFEGQEEDADEFKDVFRSFSSNILSIARRCL